MDYILKYTFYVLVLSVLMGVSTWKLYKKMGYNPLFSFIPFYNYYIILKEVGRPKWWAALSYLPIAGLVMMTVFHLFLMRKFSKHSLGDKLLTVLLPFIYLAIVNYSDKAELDKGEDEFYLTEEEKKERKKETFIGSVTFAIVFATVIHTFITQPFGIPTGSMERTLLVGDFLFVNKLGLGYRMPMRPLALPFMQSTIMDTGKKGNPKDDPKSYVNAVQLPYFRLPGWDVLKRKDIVVFNYPRDSVNTAIDRKDPYVKRCVAVSGDTVEMKAGRLFVNGKQEQLMGDQELQHSYLVYTTQELDVNDLWNRLCYLPLQEQQLPNGGYVYQFQGLTDKLLNEIKELPEFVKAEEVISPKGEKTISYFNPQRTKIDTAQSIFPINKNWNPDWYGPLRIPKKGDVVHLTMDNLPEYQWIISQYEHNKLELRDGKIFINGKPADTYTIKQNYYFMMGDNRDASLDSRFFGFVPEENILGKPMFTWMSVQGVFDPGPKKIRWDRMFKATNTGEANKTSYWWIAVIILVLFFGWDNIMKYFRKKKD